MVPRTTTSPEQIELDRLLGELGQLDSEVQAQEARVVEAERDLAAFEVRYREQIVPRLDRLDRLEQVRQPKPTEAASTEVGDLDGDHEPQRDAEEQAPRGDGGSRPQGDAGEQDDAQPRNLQREEAAKHLYRSLARALHPDVAGPDGTELMAEVNEAYENGDVETLERIEHELQYSPDRVQDDGVGGDIVRALRSLARAKDRLRHLNAREVALTSSDRWAVFEEVTAAAAQGRDLVAEMVDELDRQIAAAEQAIQANEEVPAHG